MVTTIFICVAIIFAVAVFFWVRSWNKPEKPQVSGGGYAAQNQGQETINTPTSEVLQLKATEDVLFGRDGKLVKGETFYEGKIPKNSQLYLRLSLLMKGSAVFCGINDGVAKPKIQIALEYKNKRVIGNPSNSQRQSTQPYMVHNGDNVWLSSDVLADAELTEWLVIRILWRLDNGAGYGSWQISDAINVHNIQY